MKKKISVLVVIIILQLLYYFNFPPWFFPVKKAEKPVYSSIDVLTLKGWTEQVKFLENITVLGGILSLDNTFGHAVSGNFSYVNRIDALPIATNMHIDIQFKKIEGKAITVNFATSLPENAQDWWTMEKGMELIISDGNLIHLQSFGKEVRSNEIFNIGELPQSRRILIDILDGFISVKDEGESVLGSAVFENNPFEKAKKLYFGITVSAGGIAEIERFTYNFISND